MLGFTTLSEKHKPLKEIWSINLHQEAPRWLTTVVETDDGSVLTFCPKTRIWHSERSLVWNKLSRISWMMGCLSVEIIQIPCSKSRPATQRFPYHTQETSGEEGDKVTFHTCIPHTERHGNRNVGANLSWKNSQLAGCSPNRRMSWSCVNLTKVSYCSGVERTGTHSYFWQFKVLKPRAQTFQAVGLPAVLIKKARAPLAVVQKGHFQMDLFCRHTCYTFSNNIQTQFWVGSDNTSYQVQLCPQSPRLNHFLSMQKLQQDISISELKCYLEIFRAFGLLNRAKLLCWSPWWKNIDPRIVSFFCCLFRVIKGYICIIQFSLVDVAIVPPMCSTEQI